MKYVVTLNTKNKIKLIMKKKIIVLWLTMLLCIPAMISIGYLTFTPEFFHKVESYGYIIIFLFYLFVILIISFLAIYAGTCLEKLIN